jgi:hypothetical protein
MKRLDGPHRCGNDLEPYPRNARSDHPELLGRWLGQVDNSSRYEGASIIDPDHHLRAGVQSRYADHGAERQKAVGGGKLFGSVWHRSVVRCHADFAFRG